MRLKRRNKFNVAPANARRWRGKTYDSKAEMLYAQELGMRHASGDVLFWSEQPQVILAGDLRYRPDFLVAETCGEVYYVDVKGVETQPFKQILKLWSAAQVGELRVIKKRRFLFETDGVYLPDAPASTAKESDSNG